MSRQNKDEILYQHLIQIIREERLVKNISQSELSEQIGRPQSFISKYENGQRRIDPIQLIRICNALGIHASNIIDKLENMEL